MGQEFETQVLDIDVEEITNKLRKLGAKEETEVFQKRWIFDLVLCTVKSTGEWIRLRQAGDKKPTLTYKNKIGKGLSETTELETEVEDFNKTAEILSKCKFVGKYYQENKRKKFVLNDIEFTIDSWPKIPPLLEVEAKSEVKVNEGLELLGLAGKDAGHLGIMAIYGHYNLNLHSFKELKFK